jgi:hypothetical protein
MRENCSSSQLLLPQVLHPLCSWAQMSGLSALVHPPCAIKGEHVTLPGPDFLDSDPSHSRQLKLSSNTTYNEVGYYAPSVRTTINSCVFSCSFLHLSTSKTLKPLHTLGLKAGALRHPAGDFPLRHIICFFFYLCDEIPRCLTGFSPMNKGKKNISRSGAGALLFFIHTSAAFLVMRDARLDCTWHDGDAISARTG